MMSYLTRPGMADGGRTGYKLAGEVKDGKELPKNIRLTTPGGKFRFDTQAGGKNFTKIFPKDTDLEDVIKFRNKKLKEFGIEEGKFKKPPNPKRGKYVGVEGQKHIKFNGVTYQVAVQRMKDKKMVTEKPFYTTDLDEAIKVRDERVLKSPPKVEKGVINPDREKIQAKIDKRRFIQKVKEGRTNIAFKPPAGYQVHHLLPLSLASSDTNTRDLAVINAQMNKEIAQFDKPIKILTEEATLLDYNGDRKNALKRLNEINKELNDIVKNGVKKLGPKYDGLIGFNQLTPVFDENGVVIRLQEKPVGVDFKKSIAKNIKVPEKVKNISTPELQKLVFDAPTFAANPMFSPGILKEAFKQLPTFAGAGALNLAFGVDPTSAIDRASISAEAALAPQLVKQAAKLGTTGQKVANLFLSPKMAMRVARVASPIGIASLVGEGAYQAGKFAKKRIGELKAMTPEQRQELRSEGARQAFDPFMAAGGGIAKEAGDSSGPPPESGPMSQGLQGLMKRVRNL